MKTWRAFVRLKPADRRLVLEAAAFLVFVRASLWMVAAPTLGRILRRRTGARSEFTHHRTTHESPSIDRLTWACAAASRRLPGSTTCLVQALAADALLQRHGYASRICFGVRERSRRPSPLEAHAWVECEGVVVMGNVDDLAEYARLSSESL